MGAWSDASDGNDGTHDFLAEYLKFNFVDRFRGGQGEYDPSKRVKDTHSVVRMVRTVYRKYPLEIGDHHECTNYGVTGVGVWAVRNRFALPKTLLEETRTRLLAALKTTKCGWFDPASRLESVKKELQLVKEALESSDGRVSEPEKTPGLNEIVREKQLEHAASLEKEKEKEKGKKKKKKNKARRSIKETRSGKSY